MYKMKFETVDLTDENINKVVKLFSNCATEKRY